MTSKQISSAYRVAKQVYADLGVDTESAIRKARSIPISLHCWQADDVRGLETPKDGLAGGGIKRGAAVGSSGATGNEPEETPITPEDLATTVYHQLGIPAEKELMAPGDRPIEIVKDGQLRPELLA